VFQIEVVSLLLQNALLILILLHCFRMSLSSLSDFPELLLLQLLGVGVNQLFPGHFGEVLSVVLDLITVCEGKVDHLVLLPLIALIVVSVMFVITDLLVDELVVLLLVDSDDVLLVFVKCHFLHHLSQLGALFHDIVDFILQIRLLFDLGDLLVGLQHGLARLDLESVFLAMGFALPEEIDAEGVRHRFWLIFLTRVATQLGVHEVHFPVLLC
jgi:hypothetical protein